MLPMLEFNKSFYNISVHVFNELLIKLQYNTHSEIEWFFLTLGAKSMLKNHVNSCLFYFIWIQKVHIFMLALSI